MTLFEADDRLGGHADTHPTGVDTGFIVYNERTYPLLTRLFAELGVATQPSQMSMSVRCAGCGLQYAGQRGLAGLAAGLPRGRGRYLRMLAEVPRFHRAARRVLDHGDPPDQTLADFLRTGRVSRYFTAHFALPLVAAVWSCPSGTALRYPARYLFAFLANHGMLSVSGSPPWRTVTGGSRSARCAATRITQRFSTRPARRTGSTPWSSPRTRTRRCACSATRPPTAPKRDVLGAFTYTQNPALTGTWRRQAYRAADDHDGARPDAGHPAHLHLDPEVHLPPRAAPYRHRDR